MRWQLAFICIGPSQHTLRISTCRCLAWHQTVMVKLCLRALNQGLWQQQEACALFQGSCSPSANMTFPSKYRGPASLCGPPWPWSCSPRVPAVLSFDEQCTSRCSPSCASRPTRVLQAVAQPGVAAELPAPPRPGLLGQSHTLQLGRQPAQAQPAPAGPAPGPRPAG